MTKWTGRCFQSTSAHWRRSRLHPPLPYCFRTNYFIYIECCLCGWVEKSARALFGCERDLCWNWYKTSLTERYSITINLSSTWRVVCNILSNCLCNKCTRSDGVIFNRSTWLVYPLFYLSVYFKIQNNISYVFVLTNGVNCFNGDHAHHWPEIDSDEKETHPLYGYTRCRML